MSSEAAVTALQAREQQRRLSKEEILRPQLKKEDYFWRGLDGWVTLKTLSQESRRLLREKSGANTDEYDEDKFQRLAIMYSLEEPSFTEDEIEQLKSQDALAIDEIIIAIQMFNSLGNLEALKNSSSGTQNLDSLSASLNV